MLKFKNLWVASGEEPLSNFKGNTFDMGSRIETTSFGGAQHLGFHVDQKMLEEKAPLLKVTGDLPVRFGRDGDFKSTVTLTGADATVEEGTNLVLIESKAGFQNKKDQYWNAGDDLDAHKKDLVVRSRRSVGGEDTSSIKAEDYKLKFEKSSAEGEHTLDLVAAFPKAESAREHPDPDPGQPPAGRARSAAREAEAHRLDPGETGPFGRRGRHRRPDALVRGVLRHVGRNE